jgi:hypothetical protein
MNKDTLGRITSSKKHHYGSPEYLLDLVRAVGPIGFDPVTTPTNRTQACVFATKLGLFRRGRRLGRAGQCGLSTDWGAALAIAADELGRGDVVTYANTPYGRELRYKFAPKIAIEGARAVFGGQIVIVPARVEAEWFRSLMRSEPAWRCDWGSPTLGSRIKFVGGKGDSAMFPCSLFYWGKQADLFFDVFAPHGTMVAPRHTHLPALRQRREPTQRGVTPPDVAIGRTNVHRVASVRGVGSRA